MAIRVIDDSKLQDIAVAIQGKDGGGQMTVDEMPTRIEQNLQSKAVLDSVIDGSIISIESDVTDMRSNSFSYCTNLTSVSLPRVTNMGNNVFSTCTNLTSVSLPNVTSIGNYVFYRCANLTSVSLPNVTSIGNYAFQGCTNLSIVILGKRATLSNSNAFSGTDNAITYVQPEDLSWYSTATNWSALYTAGRVKSIEELPT